MKITPITDQDKAGFRNEYQNAISTLTDIRDAPTLTNAQAIQAIQYMAKLLLFLIKLLVKLAG